MTGNEKPAKRKLMPYSGHKHRAGLVAFLDGWMGCDDDDLPDGAWQAIIEEGVAEWAVINRVCIDTLDGFMEYLEARNG